MAEPGSIGETHETARAFTDVRDFPIYVSHIDENTHIWGAPYRVWDGLTCVTCLALTVWASYVGFHSGYVASILVFGLSLTIGLTLLARQVPVARPNPIYRLLWLFTCAVSRVQVGAATGRRNPWLSPPKAVIDNLVFTHRGVYAEFLLAGQPSGMLPFSQKKRVAKGHQPLVRQLPSGLVFWGMLAPVDPRRIRQRMLHGYTHRDEWVREVRDWEPYLDIEPFYERVLGVRIPVDSGMAGRTGAGQLARLKDALVGRDHDDEQKLSVYRDLVEQILEKIPAHFEPVPSTPRQIQWLYHRHRTRGVDDRPFPHGPGGPHRLTAKDFTPDTAEFDEGDQAARRQSRSWWRRLIPSFAPVLRVGIKKSNSYQTLLPVAQFPRRGLAYPRAEYLLAVDDVDLDATADWFQHVTISSAEKGLARVDRAMKNLNDQEFQRAGARTSSSDLVERYESGEDFDAELRASRMERSVDFTTVIAVGSPTRKNTRKATNLLRTEFAEELDTSLALHRGAQRALWQIGHAGSEDQAPLTQFRHPTTSKHWARFSPLLSPQLGNEYGILLARNLATRRPSPVLLDPERMTVKGMPGVIWLGPPDGGKSLSCKRMTDAVIKRGDKVSIIDPGTKREWKRALAHHGDRIAMFDPGRAEVSMDMLQIFPREVAVEHMLDHLLPMMGEEADGIIAGQLRFLLRPDQRVAETTGGLLRYLNSLTGDQERRYADLIHKLNSWAYVDYLRAMFDESLPVPPVKEKDAIIWLTADLELPTTSETDNLHLYRRQSQRARAGLALYGIIASLTRLTYAHTDTFSWLVTEEARTYNASPVGQKETARILTQGRKEKYGLFSVSQYFEDFAAIPTQNLPARIITPFKAADIDYAREAFKKMGIDPAEYPEVLDTRSVPGHGYAYFIDDQGRAGLVDLLLPAQQELVDAFDTNYLGEDASDDLWLAAYGQVQ